MRTRQSKKEKQYYVYSGYNKKEKRTNNDLQNITQKTKDRVTRTNGQKEKDKQWSTKHYTEN